LNTAALVQQYTMGGALMAIFALIELVSLVGGWRATRAVTVGAGTVSQPVPAVRTGNELGRAIVALLAVAVVVLVLIQLIPVSRTSAAPSTPIAWDSPQTQALWTRTCADCHSNDTRWPWYGTIAPSSWLLTAHVNAGRQEINVSQLDKMPAFRKANLANDMAQQIRSGNMPPSDYLIMHPEARLSDAEKQQLIQGLQKTFVR
jgi:cytochrome c551/c552